MNRQMKWAGTAMAIGGLLMFARMAPIFAVLPEDMPFPPIATEDLVRLIEIAGARWQLSHILGLAAVSLLAIGYWLHAAILTTLDSKSVGLAAAITASLAFALFGIALLIDGFHVPEAANAYLSVVGGQGPSLEDVASAHALALSFFTPGIFLMFIAMGLLASRMLHGIIHSWWLGAFGQLIAIAAITAFLFGATGPNWDHLQVGGSAILAGFLWHLLLGLNAVFMPVAPGKENE